jgi:galactose-1-phosphate uridylyltransferase
MATPSSSKPARPLEIAQEDNDLISWYEKGKQSETLLNDVSYRTEVERIINDKKLNYFFRPIFSVDKLKTIGYLAKAGPGRHLFRLD